MDLPKAFNNKYMISDKKIKVLGIAGSLRKGSFAKALLENAKNLVPANMELESFDISEIPVFNQDFENDAPESVKTFKAKIKEADAILFVTPEYNYSIPGVLKNAIDTASRPYGDNSWEGKPAAIMSSSMGMLAGSRAQYHLRQVLVFLDMHALNRPEVMVPTAQDKFDENLILTDERTKTAVTEQLKALDAWTRKLID